MRYDKTAHSLHRYGFAVVPVFDSDETRRKWAGRVWAALDDMPEFRVKGRKAHRVLGGFGAYGNPSSFHHPTLQQLRAKLKKNVSMPLFRALMQYAAYGDNARCEMLFDRVCVRAKAFGDVSKESWHRDVHDGPKYGHRALPRTLDGGRHLDDIFGGWLNLSDGPTSFRGIAGSHRGADAVEAQRRGGGFAALSKAEIEAQHVEHRLALQANGRIGTADTDADGHIVVPPGHLLVFYQRLLHAVAGGKQPEEPQLRLFVGHRITTETVPLFPLERVLANNAVPPIPSGQTPPMYSQNHYGFFSTTDKYRTWGARTFQPACLFQRTTPDGRAYATPGSKDDRDRDANAKRYMPSLSAMGFEPYEYTSRTRRALEPEPLLARKRPKSC